MASVTLVWICLLLTPVFSILQRAFHSNLHTAAVDERQGGFSLFSLGHLHDVLLLDSDEQFKVHLGSDGHLRVQPLTSSSPNATWWQGRPLLGRRVRQLTSNGSVTERGLLAKVKATQQLNEKLFKVELDHDRDVDLIHSGVIHMQFSPPVHPLPSGLPGLGERHDLHGSETAETTVSMLSESVQFVASANRAATIATETAADDPHPDDSAGLLVKLTEVREVHRIHPSLSVKRTEDPGTKQNCYTSWTTVEVKLSGTLEFKAGSEVGVEKHHLVSSLPNRRLHRVPLLMSPDVPPLTFVTSYSSTTWLDVFVTTSGPLHFQGGFNATGNVVIESTLCDGGLPRSTLNFNGWSADVSPWNGHSHANFLAQVSIFNEVRYQSSLQWDGIPAPVRNLPALILSIKPKVTMRSSMTSDAICTHGDLTLTGQLRQEDTRRQWSVEMLTGRRSLTRPVLERALLHQCFAPNAKETTIPTGVTMETYCGVPSLRISRDDPRFQGLQVVLGDDVDFRGEESASAWCGVPGHPCPSCNSSSPQTHPCADRVMAPDTALPLSRLAGLARLKWPQQRVVVEDAWNEPNDEYPLGRHGNQSLYYEGRALRLTLTSQSEISDLQELAQFAINAGFSFAGIRLSTVEVCTATRQPEGTARHRRSVTSLTSEIYRAHFEKIAQNIKPESLSESPIPKPIPVGQSYPPGKTLDQVIGPPLDPGSRPEELHQYLFPNVEFPSAGPNGCPQSVSGDPADWCQYRAMTPRMAFRLHRLAALVRQKTQGVIMEGKETSASGMMLRLTLRPSSLVNGSEFSALAKQAGFDYIMRTSAESLQVYVKRQEGYRSKLALFQSSTFLAVLSPSEDYDLPQGSSSAIADTAVLEAEETPLVDGHNRSLSLSNHYRVGDFAHPNHRFFRLDPILLDCLELAAEELGVPPRVLPGWGYRPASVNRVNLASRPIQEREAFQQGRAVYVTPPTNGAEQKDLEKISLTLVSKCTPLLLRIHRKPGFGCHRDKLYMDVRGKTSDDVDQGLYAEVWDVDNPALYKSLSQAVQDMARGGPVIAPVSEGRACKEPLLGEKGAYFSFSTSLICIDFSNPCQATLQSRTEVANNLTAGLNAVLGRVLAPSVVSEAVRECLVTHCGGCLGAGDTWKSKVRACVKLVKLFSEHASSPWGVTRDRGAFLNPHHPQSTLHALACQKGNLCLENTQLYSLALPALHAKYKPDPGKSREELLYSGEDNASPLLEVIQQEMAHSVKGKVKVYVEREADLGVLKDTLKVLMVYNTEVTEVEFHFPDQGLQDRVLPRLQHHLEGWALRACPKWSRFAVAPFSAQTIPPSRQKRSAELSRERNEARLALHSWETEWLLRI